MSRQGTIRRYTLIIEKIGRKQFPSFEVIKEFLHEHGFDISTRTLQRDIDQIRVEFGLEITYNRSRNGYFIDMEESVKPDSFLCFLEIVNTAELLICLFWAPAASSFQCKSIKTGGTGSFAATPRPCARGC